MIKRKILTTVAAVSVAAMMTVGVFAVGWQHNVTGWWYGTNEANTTWHANCWQWIDGNNDGIAECYYFDQNGNITNHYYINDSKNKGIDLGHKSYTRISE